ncbi:hypothetical protein H3N56_11290 [Cetobacterium sp. 2A]|uniref:hypothetical protein n=1 Tax=Cetobacterium sp. 2A TaxID=2754723 RepID=UPI00163D2466|nr:hypothetical protein [Cetobacterium sp. 2A]MBC2857016.1 hypothetical protein [Cetobacterium sp. 2A]
MGKKFHKHNILFRDDEYIEIKEYCKKIGVSISRFIREVATEKIKKLEEQNLLDFVSGNCKYLAKEEKKEVINFIESSDVTKEEFEEIIIDDILQR